MGALFVYILKSSCCLALFYLFYKLLLGKETFFRFNRFAVEPVTLAADENGIGLFAVFVDIVKQ